MEIQLTETQIAYARAILLIERKMEPKCAECGVGANRPNCAQDMGGYCKRHEQEDVIGFVETVDSLERAAGFHDRKMAGWRYSIHPALVYELSDAEKSLLHDLYDLHVGGNKHTTRAYDGRFSSLSDKNLVGYSSQYDKWNVSLSRQGLVWAKELFGE